VPGKRPVDLPEHPERGDRDRLIFRAPFDPRLTIASIAELGVKYAIDQVEKEHGGPYPPREAELKGGRPLPLSSGSGTSFRVLESPAFARRVPARVAVVAAPKAAAPISNSRRWKLDMGSPCEGSPHEKDDKAR
jgi:hypothetical protein